ncbi:MAG TPA: phosphohistidine phosphatase SixA [Planctomycetota bacterium]|nr:phosphohistidine phosphatase SixA [Planctomycetota bacterium]
MKVIIARHGAAEDKADSKEDADRILTAEGREQADLLGRVIAATLGTVEGLWTSPLMRALQTAGIASKRIKIKPEIEPNLGIGGDIEQLCWKLHREALGTVMLVGHQPDLGRLAARLLGFVSEVSLKKGGVCIVETRDPAKQVGRALASLDPRQYKDILEGREYVPWMRSSQRLESPEER